MKNILILADGGLNIFEAKTAIGVIKYGNYNILGIIDKINENKLLKDVINIDYNIPIFSSISVALRKHSNIDTLLLGTAPKGGILPESWKEHIIEAIKNKLNIINGLHILLNEDNIIKNIAIENNVNIWDVRKPTNTERVCDLRSHTIKSNVILTVGTDCNVGKMTTALELSLLLKNEFNTVFVPTGQTGIMISGWGQPIDAIKADFISGTVEDIVIEASNICNASNDFIIVEGQASIIHPGYSCATISLIHGSGADALILCHCSSRKYIRRYEGKLRIPPLKEIINIYNVLTSTIKYAPIIGISLNTYGLTDEEAIIEINKTIEETGLPVTDPVRYGSKILVDALKNFTKDNVKN